MISGYYTITENLIIEAARLPMDRKKGNQSLECMIKNDLPYLLVAVLNQITRLARYKVIRYKFFCFVFVLSFVPLHTFRTIHTYIKVNTYI